ncbi:MAG: hypothetical protein JNL62_03545 [Bryobacterales bacterium]|nr:hypothetical protein [Bryobacterales bacterium]
MPRHFLLWLTILASARAGSLEDAVKSVSKGLSARLAVGESVRITARNLTGLPAQELDKARALVQRALRRTPARNKPPLDLYVYLSENASGYLLVAELRRTAAERFVETAQFDAEPAPAAMRPVLSRRLLWEQDMPLLDAVPVENRMLVLSAHSISLHQQRDGRWEQIVSKPLAITPTRDPRGHLHAAPPAFRAVVNGAACDGVLQPEFHLMCSSDPPQSPSAETVPLASGLTLKATSDGRLQVLNAQQNVVSTHDGWGSTIASPPENCGTSSLVFHTAAGDWHSPDTLSLHDWSTGKPVETGNRLEFPAPITELRPRPGGTLVITANHAQESYSAYLVTVDCSR